MFDAVVATPIGNLGLTCHLDKVISIHFLERRVIPFPFKPLAKVKKIAKRIEAFFSHPQSLIDVPHAAKGTPFQRRVWKALCQIPVGEVCSYGELAEELDTSARAIGMACRVNPLPLIIPCHRVVSANDLGGYCGKTDGDMLFIKQWLLAHEQGSC